MTVAACLIAAYLLAGWGVLEWMLSDALLRADWDACPPKERVAYGWLVITAWVWVVFSRE